MSKRPKAPTVVKAVSPFASITETPISVDGLFDVNTRLNGNALETRTQLGQPLSQLQQTSLGGLNTVSTGLTQSPQEQFAALQRGENPWFTGQSDILQRELRSTLDGLDKRFAQAGLVNATSRGAALATQAGNSSLQQAQLAADALAQQEASALQRGTFLRDNLDWVNRAQLPYLGQSVDQLNGALGTNAQVNLANADAQNRANMAAFQAAQQRQSFWMRPFSNAASAGLSPVATSLGNGLASGIQSGFRGSMSNPAFTTAFTASAPFGGARTGNVRFTGGRVY